MPTTETLNVADESAGERRWTLRADLVAALDHVSRIGAIRRSHAAESVLDLNPIPQRSNEAAHKLTLLDVSAALDGGE